MKKLKQVSSNGLFIRKADQGKEEAKIYRKVEAWNSGVNMGSVAVWSFADENVEYFRPDEEVIQLASMPCPSVPLARPFPSDRGDHIVPQLCHLTYPAELAR